MLAHSACAKFYPKGRLTWRYFFAIESCAIKHCWSGKSILQSLSAFLDIQDTRIVTLYRGVSQKVEFRSTARMNLQKLVGSVQSELCKRCFAKKTGKCNCFGVLLCSFRSVFCLGLMSFDWNAPLCRCRCQLKVQHRILTRFPLAGVTLDLWRSTRQ